MDRNVDSGKDHGRDPGRRNQRAVGSGYEEVAAAYLVSRGYTVLERNYRDRYGEIDIIARDGRYLVFIEVKYRKNADKGDPAEAVGRAKQQRIRHTAGYYLYSHHCPEDTPCRFDVVCILGGELRLIQDAF